jgi:REP element-mobilizing transposase RayT
MRSRYQIRESRQAHFVTATIVEWLPVFTTAACCDILVDALKYCRAHKGLLVHAWVIMDNHFHAVVAGPDLAATLGNLKKFTSRRLLAQIEQEGRGWLVQQLAFFRAPHKLHSTYQVWQEGVHPKALPTDEILLQKIDYIHRNPVQRGWVYVPEDWRYSSAHQWRAGATPVMRSDPWRDFGPQDARPESGA